MKHPSIRETINGVLKWISPTNPAPATVYTAAFISAMLYSIVTAGGPGAVQALGLTLGQGIVTGLIGSVLLDGAKNAEEKQRELKGKIEEALRENAEELRAEIDKVFQWLSSEHQDILTAIWDARGLTDDDRAWLRDEFAKLQREWRDREERERALRMSYLNSLLKDAGRIDLIGIDRKAAEEEDARQAEVQVGAIYVPLQTSELEEDELRGLRQGSKAVAPSAADDERTRRMVSAIAQLDRHDRLVLLGDPGSGKSTFVKFVASCLAGEALANETVNLATLVTPVPADEREASSESWSHGALLPVMVELRKFAARGLPAVGETATGEYLWQFIARELNESALGEYAPMLRVSLRCDGGLLLLDGLDEVPEAEQRRRQIIEAIEGFAAAFPRCRLLVTSRTYAYLNQRWRLRDFHEAKLMPFDRPRIDAFIARWYAQATVTRRRTPGDAAERARRLMREVGKNPRLYELAQRPLILTLMAALHDWRGGELPEKRWQLYEEAVDLLLERWNKKKTYRDGEGRTVELPNLAEWLKVDRAKVRLLLNRLAYEAHAAQPELTGTADIREDDLVLGLFRIRTAAGIDQAQIIDYLQERAGLLVAHGAGVYTFPHRTFQEYLAACHLTDRDDPDALAELVHAEPNRWREVALLAGAKAGVWTLADALCPDGVSTYPCGKTPCDAWGALIAGLGLAESAVLPPETRRNTNILARLQPHLCCILAEGKLPAIERAAAGNVLATIGDPRFHGADGWFLPIDPPFGFIEIPAGEFLMGSNKEDDPDASGAELPRHRVTLPAYYIGKYPVTVAQFRAFVEANPGFKVSDPDCLKGPANHPVVWVTWHEALEYCAWLTGVLRDQQARHGALFSAFAGREWTVTLPSEAEWEKAARGTEARRYPWGPDWDANRANCSETGIDGTSAVGCFPGSTSPYKVEDMSGNVWEWTRSLYTKYPYVARDGRENPKGKGDRVLRGGCWNYDNPDFFRCASRHGGDPTCWGDYIGFRCVLASPGP